MKIQKRLHGISAVLVLFIFYFTATNVPEISAMTNRSNQPKTDTAWFAGGCFWGMEYQFRKVPGVISTRVGYMGGHKDHPTYEEVCSGTTGHLETLEVVFDPSETTYETLAKLFFEIHDPTQTNGQGPDIGEQYLSAVFCKDEKQKETIEKLITILRSKGLDVVTRIREAGTFWPAEEYHQDYYSKTGGTPYCHIRVKRFE
jgi:peptide methionine sulfoxide reductase msrA/msrB